MATPLDFAKALLNRLGLSHTKNRLVSLVAFAAQEGGHWGNTRTRYNPFNTSLSMPGATNAVGQVKAYKDWPQGIEATARTIAQNNMRPILDALKADADPKTFQHAVTSTPWCPQSIEGCEDYANANPLALYNSWANKQDSTSITTTSGTPWATIITAAVAVGVIGSVGYYYKTGHLPFMRR